MRQSGRCTRASAVQIGALNAKFGRFAGAIAERSDVVENPIETCVELIDAAVRKNVSFRYGHITPVIRNVLGAGKSALLGKSWRPTGDERRCLVVAEARKY